MTDPTVAFVGCWPKTNWLAAAAVTVTAALPDMELFDTSVAVIV